MARSTEPPVITRTGDSIEDYRVTHPSFAQVEVSRVQGGAVLYGSELRHREYISLSISNSQMVRGISTNRFFIDGLPLIEIALTEHQWSTLVSSLNIGGGVPCTLQSIRSGDFQEVPELERPLRSESVFRKEVRDHLQSTIDDLADLRKIVGEGNLSAKMRSQIESRIDRIEKQLGSNLPFISEQFDRHMEETVEEARASVNAYVINQAHTLGLKDVQTPVRLTRVKKKDSENG